MVCCIRAATDSDESFMLRSFALFTPLYTDYKLDKLHLMYIPIFVILINAEGRPVFMCSVRHRVQDPCDE